MMASDTNPIFTEDFAGGIPKQPKALYKHEMLQWHVSYIDEDREQFCLRRLLETWCP